MPFGLLERLLARQGMELPRIAAVVLPRYQPPWRLVDSTIRWALVPRSGRPGPHAPEKSSTRTNTYFLIMFKDSEYTYSTTVAIVVSFYCYDLPNISIQFHSFADDDDDASSTLQVVIPHLSYCPRATSASDSGILME